MKATKRVEDLRQKITMRSRGIMVALDARVAASRQYVENLDSAIQSAMTNDMVLAERSRPYFEKQRELDELIRFRQILNMKIAAEKIDSGLPQRSMVEIIDQAQIPLRPSSPNRLSGMSFSVLGLLLIALGLVMVKGATRLVPLQHPA